MKRLFFLFVVMLCILVGSSSFAAWNETTVRKGQPELLKSVIEKASTTKNAVVVFDLDSTLLDARLRSLRIYHEYGSQFNIPELFNVERRNVAGWNFRDHFLSSGMKKDLALKLDEEIKTFWKPRFFSNEYVANYDIPLPGALDYVNTIYKTGANIVYITGRNDDLKTGTIATLKHFGFPINVARTTLIMKPAKLVQKTEGYTHEKQSQIDEDYKITATKKAKAIGNVIAVFDNEPTHINLYSDQFQGATVVFVDTDTSPLKTKPYSTLPVINGWLMK